MSSCHNCYNLWKNAYFIFSSVGSQTGWLCDKNWFTCFFLQFGKLKWMHFTKNSNQDLPIFWLNNFASVIISLNFKSSSHVNIWYECFRINSFSSFGVPCHRIFESRQKNFYTSVKSDFWELWLDLLWNMNMDWIKLWNSLVKKPFVHF